MCCEFEAEGHCSALECQGPWQVQHRASPGLACLAYTACRMVRSAGNKCLWVILTQTGGAAAWLGTEVEEQQQRPLLVPPVVAAADAVVAEAVEAWDWASLGPQRARALGRSLRQSRYPMLLMPDCGTPHRPQPTAAAAGGSGGDAALLLLLQEWVLGNSLSYLECLRT